MSPDLDYLISQLGEIKAYEVLAKSARAAGVDMPRLIRPGDIFLDDRMNKSYLVLGHAKQGRRGRGHTFIHLYGNNVHDCPLLTRPHDLRNNDCNALMAEQFFTDHPPSDTRWLYCGNLDEWLDNDVLRKAAAEVAKRDRAK